MKYSHLFLIALISYTSVAQDPRLFENSWYLQNVIIDGQDNFPPSNDEVPYVPLSIYEIGFLLETSICNLGSGIVHFDSDSTFFFTDGISLTLSDCNNPENGIFEGIYFNDFFNSANLTVNDVFSYEIIDAGDNTYTLTIISPTGDKAIYGNGILSTTDVKDLRVTIYPNPTSNFLYIERETPIEKVVIYDIMGRNVLEASLMPTPFQLDLNGLKKGMYFAEIKSQGKRSVQKIIKN